jgi:hypothetical protein
LVRAKYHVIVKDPLDFSHFRFWALVGAVIPLLAGLVTWATGYLTVLSQSRGFPMPWRELFFQSCGMPACIGPWLRSCHICGGTSVRYDLVSFALDTVFITAVGYSLVLALPLVSRALKSVYARREVPKGVLKSVDGQVKAR